jgi:hypothetical protein
LDDLPDDAITGHHDGPHGPGATRPAAENIEKGTDVDKVSGLDEAEAVPSPGPHERAPERDERGRL